MKTAYFGPGPRSGVDVTFVRKTGIITVGAWYDSMVGIEGEKLTLRAFCERVGISERDCARAWSDTKQPARQDES